MFTEWPVFTIVILSSLLELTAWVEFTLLLDIIKWLPADENSNGNFADSGPGVKMTQQLLSSRPPSQNTQLTTKVFPFQIPCISKRKGGGVWHRARFFGGFYLQKWEWRSTFSLQHLNLKTLNHWSATSGCLPRSCVTFIFLASFYYFV